MTSGATTPGGDATPPADEKTRDDTVSTWPARAAAALNRQFGSELEVEASPGEARSAAVPDEPARPVDEASMGDRVADAVADLADSLLGDSTLDDEAITSGDLDDDAPSVRAPERVATTDGPVEGGAANPPLPMPRVSAQGRIGGDAGATGSGVAVEGPAPASADPSSESLTAMRTTAAEGSVEAPRRAATTKRGGRSVMASPLLTMPRVRHPEAVALFVHGGDVEGALRVRRGDPAYLRMVPFARDVERRSHGRIGGALLRLSVRGWNEPEKPAVQDARWAIGELRRRYPAVPIAVVGHSMGGRVVLDVAASEHPAAVVALAPWAAEAYDASQFRDVPLLAIHGRHDTVTDPAATKGLVERIEKAGGDAEFVSMPGWHAMLLRAPRWHAVTSEFLIDRLLPALH